MAWRSSSEACRNGRRSRGAWHCSWGGERVGNMVPMKVWKLVKPPTTSLVGFLFHEVSCYLLHLVTGCSCAVSISSLTPIQHPAEACCGPTLFKVPFGFLLKQVSKVILVLWYCWWPNFCTILDVLAPLNWIEEHTLNWLPDFTQHDRTWYKDWAFSKLMVCSSGWTLLIWWPSFRSFFFEMVKVGNLPSNQLYTTATAAFPIGRCGLHQVRPCRDCHRVSPEGGRGGEKSTLRICNLAKKVNLLGAWKIP